MRAFIAIPVCESVTSTLRSAIEPLKSIDSSVVFTRESSYHITVKFFNTISEEMIRCVAEKLSKQMLPAPLIEICGVGFFPNRHDPKVFWAGVNSEGLSNIFAQVEDVCANLNLPKDERDFSPHLTLGRFKGRISSAFTEAAKKMDGKNFGSFVPQSLSVFSSQLKSSGAVHAVLAEIPFLNNND